MRHEKIIKRENGNSVKIEATVYLDSYGTQNAVYSVDVSLRDKGKRIWRYVTDHDSFEYRKLNLQERKLFDKRLFLEHVTEEEIQAAKEELWQLLKP